MPGIEIFFFWLVMGFGISTMQLPWTSGSGNIRLWYITVDAGYSCRDIAFVRILGYRYGLRGWRMPCCSVQVRRSMYTDMVPSAARKVEMEIIDERWRSVCSKSNSQSQSSTEQTVQRTATRVQDCEINPVRPTEPQEPQWKKKIWRDDKRLIFFSFSWFLVCRVWPDPVYLPIRLNVWLWFSLFIPLFRVWRTGFSGFPWTDGCWPRQLSTVSVRFPGEFKSLNRTMRVFVGCIGDCRAIANTPTLRCAKSKANRSGSPRACPRKEWVLRSKRLRSPAACWALVGLVPVKPTRFDYSLLFDNYGTLCALCHYAPDHRSSSAART